jgi:hypothetical protein
MVLLISEWRGADKGNLVFRKGLMTYGIDSISDLKILTKEAVVFILALSSTLGREQRTNN